MYDSLLGRFVQVTKTILNTNVLSVHSVKLSKCHLKAFLHNTILWNMHVMMCKKKSQTISHLRINKKHNLFT